MTIQLKDIIVLIPGILGSVLFDDIQEKEVWNESILSNTYFRANKLRFLKIPIELESLKVEEASQNNIKATRLLERFFAPPLEKFGGYRKVREKLEEKFEIIPGSFFEKDRDFINNSEVLPNFFEFPYDWRQDNRKTAELLAHNIKAQLIDYKEKSENKNAKVILLAHSMGGLIARYYLDILGGAEDCKALITFGTPFSGSIGSLENLIHTYDEDFDPKGIIRSFPSIYQLLPINNVIKIENTYQKIQDVTKFPIFLREKATEAIDFHNEILEKIKTQERSYQIISIVGVEHLTKQSAEIIETEEENKNNIDIRIQISENLPSCIDEAWGDGDGTVPHYSAIPYEQKHNLDTKNVEYFPISERHEFIQSNDVILDSVASKIAALTYPLQRDILETDSFIKDVLKSHKSGQLPIIKLDINEYYNQSASNINIYAYLYNSKEEGLIGTLRLLPDTGGSLEVFSNKIFEKEDDHWVLKLDNLNIGLYEIVVETYSSEPFHSVHGLFEVVNTNL